MLPLLLREFTDIIQFLLTPISLGSRHVSMGWAGTESYDIFSLFFRLCYWAGSPWLQAAPGSQRVILATLRRERDLPDLEDIISREEPRLAGLGSHALLSAVVKREAGDCDRQPHQDHMEFWKGRRHVLTLGRGRNTTQEN